MKVLTNKRDGISLVALIVTIIVLIILTGAVIVTFMDGGIIDKAKKAVFRSDIRNYQDILLVKNANNKINRETGRGDEELLNAETLAEIQAIIPEFKNEYENLVKIENGKLILGTRDNQPYRGWLIELGIEPVETKWKLIEDNDGNGEVSIGDLITSKKKNTEQFYVIGINGNTVSMLAEKNITITETLEQSDSALPVAFSSTNYWSSETSYPLDLNNYEIPEGETSIVTIAKTYGKLLEATRGRLLKIEELKGLGADFLTGNEHNITSCPDFIKTSNYWLGSTTGENTVWAVFGGWESVDPNAYTEGGGYGVRPVVEVSILSIEKEMVED